MAVLTVAAASVAWVSGPTKTDQVAGQAFIAGALVYQADNGTWLKAQGDGTAIEAGANDVGIALFTADAARARGTIAVSGAVVTLGTGTGGVTYCVGDTAGGIYPDADVGSGDKKTVIGVGIGINRLYLQRIYNAGSVLA